jgi:hypothetical protein
MAAYAGAPRVRRHGYVRAKGAGPDVVAKRVVAVANDPHPKLHNTITLEAKQFTLRRWILPPEPSKEVCDVPSSWSAPTIGWPQRRGADFSRARDP